MSKPENTAARDPNLHFLFATSEGVSSYIEGMEAAGQRQMVASNCTVLPTDAGATPDREFEALGFTFGEPDPSDPLFRSATLPEGWRKEGSDHAMWSYILDPQNRRRVSIFYKAAFYDRRAHMGLTTVYSYARGLVGGDDMPVYDDQWCTAEAFAAALADMRNALTERIEQYEGSSSEWAADALKEAREELSAHDAWVSRFITEGEPSK